MTTSISTHQVTGLRARTLALSHGTPCLAVTIEGENGQETTVDLFAHRSFRGMQEYFEALSLAISEANRQFSMQRAEDAQTLAGEVA